MTIVIAGTRVQSSSLAGVSSIAVTRTDVQFGDGIQVYVVQSANTKRTLSVSDNRSGGSNSYTQLGTDIDITGADDASHSQWVALAGGYSGTANSLTVTATFTGGTAPVAGIWVELIRGGIGVPGGSAFAGQSQIGAGTTTDGLTSTNGTPQTGTQAWLIVGQTTNDSASYAANAGTGFTSAGTGWDFGFGTDLARTESKRVTSSSAVAATFTNPTAANDFVTLVSIWREAPFTGMFFGAGTTS